MEEQLKMKKVKKIVKDDIPVIYKQDIMDDNGKLNVFGAFLVIGTIIIALNTACKYLQENIIDKDNIN